MPVASVAQSTRCGGGDEVLVDFVGGDCDRPLIVSRVFGGATEPVWHTNGLLSGLRSKEYQGTGFNQLVLDDSTGQNRVHLYSSSYQTHLHLGYLIHQERNTRGVFSAPLIERVGGGKVAWLGKVGAGIEGAAARAEALAAGKAVDVAVATAMDAAGRGAGVVIADRAALLMIGRAVLFLSGWEVAIAVTVIQLLIAYWEDDDVQSWLEKCTFGKSAKRPPWSAGKQHEEFEKALKAVGLHAEGQAE